MTGNSGGSTGPGDPLRALRHGRFISGTTGVVLIAGLLVTAALTTFSFLNYDHSEQRLTSLQGGLTSALLQTAPVQVEATLDRVVGLAAESSDPTGTFRGAFSPLLKPKGPFTSGSLVLIRAGKATELDHLGAHSIRTPKSPSVESLFMEAASHHTLVTTRAVGRHVQRLGYLVSAVGPGGTYVIGASQQLAIHQKVKIPRTSPESNTEIALYFGRTIDAQDLIESNVSRLPIGGTVSVSHVSFGNHSLTLVISPRSPLSGTWSADLPWVVLGLGLLLSALVAGLSERLSRRRSLAEALAGENEELYRRQRDVAATLQRSLLPRSLPSLEGLDVAARYVPAAAGAEVGGDWYSLVRIGPTRTFFIVGDVSGHGVEAAGVMGSLRFAVRTLARLGFSPAALLRRADEEMENMAEGHFATALAGLVDTDRSAITFASAGHPPPLLVEGGHAWFAQVPVGLPLGVEPRRYEELTVSFGRGATCLAFTDGLVERRGENLDEGLARVAKAASAAPGDLDQLVDRVIAENMLEDHEDDVAVLSIRRR